MILSWTPSQIASAIMRATPPIMHPHRLCSLRTQIYCINEYFDFNEAARFSNNSLNEYYDLYSSQLYHGRKVRRSGSYRILFQWNYEEYISIEVPVDLPSTIFDDSAISKNDIIICSVPKPTRHEPICELDCFILSLAFVLIRGTKYIGDLIFSHARMNARCQITRCTTGKKNQ